MQSRKYYVSGKVQGVYYRKSIRTMARKVKLSGYVKNLSDGRVEACVSCEDKTCFERFEAILRQGSLRSRVDGIEIVECSERFSGLFEVR